MFMGWENQYCQDDSSPQINLYIFNALPLKIPGGFFIQIERLIVKGKGPKRAIIITKVKFSFEELHYLISELTVLMVFQLCCPALQIGQRSRIQSPGKTLMWSNDFQQRCWNSSLEGSIVVIEQLDIQMQYLKIPFPHIINKINLI